MIELFAMIAEHQQSVGALYPRMEATVRWEILRQAPFASDLRFLLTVLRIVREFEHAHRSVMQIAARVNHGLSRSLSPRSRWLIERMGNLAGAMWRQVADAWYHRDRSAADTLGPAG